MISHRTEDPIVVGVVGGAYGIRGWVRLRSYTVPPGNLLDYQPWFLLRSGQWQPVDVLETRPRGDGFVASFSGVEDRDAAVALSGCEIGVPAGSFPPAEAGEYYWRDLIGLEVINSDGSVLGSVAQLMETGAHDVLVVKGDRDRLIPFVRQYVSGVDTKEGLLRVDWMDFD